MIEKKIKSKQQLLKISRALKTKGKGIGFTNGCFDILHTGHVKYLEAAKDKCDVLVVGVNSDKSIKLIKGNQRPIIKQSDRCRIVAALESVDFVTVFEEMTPYNLIKLLKPDILIKGSDWDIDEIIGRKFVQSYGGRVLTVPYIKGYSTSSIIKSIASKFTPLLHARAGLSHPVRS